MKKIIMFLMAVSVVSFTSCGNKSKNDEKIHDLLEEVRSYHSDMEKYNCVCLHADTKEVAIHFKDGESPFFSHAMLTGRPTDNAVVFDFFAAEDVAEDGVLRAGAVPCRHFNVFLPEGEKIKSWGKEIVLARADGSEHVVKYVLVDQPE